MLRSPNIFHTHRAVTTQINRDCLRNDQAPRDCISKAHRLEDDGGNSRTKLKNVLYVPSLPVNLFSGSIITKHGAYYCGRTMTIRKAGDDTEIAAIKLNDSTPFLRTHSENSSLALHATNKPTTETWHRRLGHLGYDNVLKTALQTTGIKLGDVEMQRPGTACRSCILSKSQRTVSRKPQTRARHAFDTLHTDVIGPITPKGYSGALWAANFTDDFSRFRWVYSFKQKNEACPTTMNFKYVKTQHNRDIKVLRMDNRNEYGGGKLLDEVFKQKGIRQEETVPYTPEQNGVAERGNQTLLERVKSICINTEAPKDLWPELFAGMVHIMIGTATTSLNGPRPLRH